MYLGIDIGGSKLLAVALDATGRAAGSWTLRTGASFSADRAQREIGALVAAAGRVEAVGVGFPGLVDAASGVVRSSVMLGGWDEHPLRERLERALGIPCAVDNDVNNAARAEHAARARHLPRAEDFLLVAVGTGVGGALVIDGRVWTGVSGLAGEIGHVSTGADAPCACGRTGCATAVAGGRALLGSGATRRRAECRLDGGSAAVSLSTALESARPLGSAIADAMNLLNLPLVVLGGGVARLGEPYRAAVERAFRASAMREVADACRVELARAGYAAGAIGGALLAMEAVRPRRRARMRPA